MSDIRDIVGRRVAAVALASTLVIAIATQGVAQTHDNHAHEKAPPAKGAAKVQTADSQTQSEFVGPPLPASVNPRTKRPNAFQRRIGSTPANARQITPRKAGAQLPRPTIVLKPGEVPAVEFDTPTYNFGRIRAGTDIRHDFWFTNTGTGPLEILAVKPG